MAIKNNLLTICIIIPGKFSVPAIMGGAIETLMTYIIDVNEKEKKFNFVIISSYCSGVEEYMSKYKYTNFKYIKTNKILSKLINGINYGILKISGNIDCLSTPFHWKAKRILKRLHADYVVVEHGVFKHFGWLRNYFNRNRIYLHIHGYSIEPNKETKDTFGNIITVSEFVKNTWFNDYNVKNSNYYICKNGIDERMFSAKISTDMRKKYRSNMGIKEKDILIIYCGRLIEIKGIKELMEAVLAIDNPKIKLMVIGSSNFKSTKITKYEKNLIKMMQMSNRRIFFTGYIDNNELYRYYQCGDIQCCPSLCEEGALLVGIEAMMSGLPIIVTNSGGCTEYIDKNCALIIDKKESLYNERDRKEFVQKLKEGIISLADDEERRKKMGENAKKIGAMYTRREFFDSFIEIFEERNV